MNIPNGYTNKDVVRLVKDIQAELKAKTDISFTFKPVKRVREFVSIEFKINKAKAIKETPTLREKMKSLKLENH